MKYYIVKNNNELNYSRCGADGFVPVADEVYECPEDITDVQDLDIVEELDEFEQLVKRPVLNESKKAARLQTELEAQDVQKWVIMRRQRDQLLSACDFTQLADAPLSVELKASYLAYRQELRDLPENIIDINNFEWPIKPS